jgi:hypothetical protein
LSLATGQSLSVYGDWDNAGTLNAATGSEVRFEGTGSATLRQTGSGIFSRLLMDKTTGLRLLSAVQVQERLTLLNGELDLNTRTLTLKNGDPAALQRTPPAYLRSETDAAFNPSRLCWETGTFTGTYVIPFGVSATDYLPVELEKLTPSVTTLCLSTRATAAPDNQPWTTGVSNMIGGSGATAFQVIDRWWDITSTLNPLPIPGANLTLRYRGVENTIPVSPTQPLAVQHYEAGISDWEAPFPPGDAGQTSGVGEVRATGVRKFSPFVISTFITPLPIRFLSLQASRQSQGVSLQWSAVASDGVGKYSVERSVDGRNFLPLEVPVYQMDANRFQALDASAGNGVLYYRIRGVEESGGLYYSPLASVRATGTLLLQLLPNPSPAATGTLQVQASAGEPVHVFIHSLTGSLLWEQEAITDKQGVYQVQPGIALPGGVYVVSVQSTTTRVQARWAEL